MPVKFSVLKDINYRRFVVGYGFSFIMYWVTLLAIGWWTWEMTRSASWVGLMFFCDLFPAVLVTPWASTLADRGDRFRILKTVLWVQVVTGFLLAAVALSGLLTPHLLAVFVAVEGMLVGFSQPAFFGLVNRLVPRENLSAAVGFNSGVIQTSYVIGPMLAGLLFSVGLEIAPIAFAANAGGTLVYLWALSRIRLQTQPESTGNASSNTASDILEGLTVLWRNPVIFQASIVTLAIAILQRPLLSLMPALNDTYSLFSSAYFTVLTACYMGGAVVASLIHAARNSDHNLPRLTARAAVVSVILYLAMFILLDVTGFKLLTAIILIFLLGIFCGFVWTGNTIVLQNRTPEHLRSRVLGNNFMLNRTLGAAAVALCGIVVDTHGMTNGMLSVAVFVAVVLGLAFARQRTSNFTNE